MSFISAYTQPEDTVTIQDDAQQIVAELDSEPIAFCARLLSLVDDLEEGKVLIIRKVIF